VLVAVSEGMWIVDCGTKSYGYLGCLLTQVNLHNGRKMVVYVVELVNMVIARIYYSNCQQLYPC